MINKFTGEKEYVTYESGNRVELAEDDSPPITDKEFDGMEKRYGLDGLASILGEAAVAPLRKGGRPTKEVKKVPLYLRVDPEIAQKLRGSGKGWQTRLNQTLHELMDEGRL